MGFDEGNLQVIDLEVILENCPITVALCFFVDLDVILENCPITIPLWFIVAPT